MNTARSNSAKSNRRPSTTPISRPIGRGWTPIYERSKPVVSMPRTIRGIRD